MSLLILNPIVIEPTSYASGYHDYHRNTILPTYITIQHRIQYLLGTIYYSQIPFGEMYKHRYSIFQ